MTRYINVVHSSICETNHESLDHVRYPLKIFICCSKFFDMMTYLNSTYFCHIMPRQPTKTITLSIIARTRPRRNRHPNRLHIVHFIHFADLYQDAQNKPSTARKCHVSATFWGCCNVSLGLKCQCSSCKCKGEDQAKEHLFLSESAKTYLPLR